MSAKLTALQLLTTSQLLGVQTRDHIRFATIFLLKYFNSSLPFHTKEIAFEEIFKGKKLAPFCSPFVDGVVERSKGSQMSSFSPPYVKSKHRVDPARLIERMPGEEIFGSLNPAQRRLAAIAANQVDEEEAILRRLEWMAVQVVLTGKVLCEGENHEAVEVDFGRRSENTRVLVGAAAWDTVDKETYDPTQDIEDWALNSTGIVTELHFDRKGFNLFRQFKNVQDKLDKTNASMSDMELGPMLTSVMQYKGNFGQYKVYVVDHRYENDDGVETPFMPDNFLLLTGPHDGKMAYGAIQDGEAIAGGLFQGSRFARHWKEGGDVVSEYTKRECAPCPFTPDVNFFVTVKLA